jgi:GMP synthase-like glutamine amidotransferase
MRVHTLQHVPFEGLGSIAAWLAQRDSRVTTSALYAEAELPKLDTFDWLIVLGGPMSANDDETLPWLAGERRLIAEAVAAGKLVLGLCLGAQLLARSLGATVTPNPEREIGWFEIEPTRDAADSPHAAVFQPPMEAFHWHGETFALPPGATHLARSAGCEHQAFAVGERVLGLQFHLETTPEVARALIEHCPEDLTPGRWVQPPVPMLADRERFRRINRAMSDLLDHLASRTD